MSVFLMLFQPDNPSLPSLLRIPLDLCRNLVKSYLHLFINTSHSLTNVRFQQQQQNPVSFHILVLTEQCVLLNHFLFMFSICYSEGEKSSKLFLEQTPRITTNLTSHLFFLDDVTIKQLKLIPGTDCPQNISPNPR